MATRIKRWAAIVVILLGARFACRQWDKAEIAENLPRWERLEATARTMAFKGLVEPKGEGPLMIRAGYPLAEYGALVDDHVDYLYLCSKDGEVWYQLIVGERWIFAVYDEANPMSSKLLESFNGKDEVFHKVVHREPGFVVFRKGMRD
jgi:hypothetical protein